MDCTVNLFNQIVYKMFIFAEKNDMTLAYSKYAKVETLSNNTYCIQSTGHCCLYRLQQQTHFNSWILLIYQFWVFMTFLLFCRQ